MKRKSKKEPLQVTSFRLPERVKKFLRDKADAADRTMSYVLVEYFDRWIAFESEQAKQPKIQK